MEIIIVRQEHKPWGIDGHLYINRQRVCDTVEHPTCCRPQGEYQVALDNNPFRHGDGALSSIHGEIIVGKLALPNRPRPTNVSTNGSRKPSNATPPSASRLEVDSQSEPTSYPCEFVFLCHLTLKPIHSRAICKNYLHI